MLEIEMRINVLLIIVWMAISFMGCNKQDDESLNHVRASIAQCRELVTDCKTLAPSDVRYAVFKRAFDQIAAVSDSSAKAEMAKELASLIETVDLRLTDTDYAGFVDRVTRFKTLLDWSVCALFDAKVDGAYVFECLTSGMARYRMACYSIPITAKANSESHETYSRRCQAIVSLAGEYEYAMMALDKAEDGHLQCLPKELHDQYCTWKKSISAYPKAKDVRARVYSIR